MIQENKTSIQYDLPVPQALPDFLLLLDNNGIKLTEEQRSTFISQVPDTQQQIYMRLVEKKFEPFPNSTMATCSNLNASSNKCNFRTSECIGLEKCQSKNPSLHATFSALDKFNGVSRAK